MISMSYSRAQMRPMRTGKCQADRVLSRLVDFEEDVSRDCVNFRPFGYEVLPMRNQILS